MTRSSSISGFSTPFSLDPLLAVKLRDVGSCLSPSLSLSSSFSLAFRRGSARTPRLEITQRKERLTSGFDAEVSSLLRFCWLLG